MRHFCMLFFVMVASTTFAQSDVFKTGCNGLEMKFRLMGDLDEDDDVPGSLYCSIYGSVDYDPWDGWAFKEVAIDKSYKGHVDIPSTIMGYPVKFMDYGAFYSCNFSSIHIPSSIGRIEEPPFGRNTYLLSATVDGYYDCLGGCWFPRCPNLKYLTLGRSVPMDIIEGDYDTEEEEMENHFPNYQRMTLFVPDGSKSAYQNKPGWRLFGTIKEENRRKTFKLEADIVGEGSVQFYGPGVVYSNGSYYVKEGTVCYAKFNNNNDIGYLFGDAVFDSENASSGDNSSVNDPTRMSGLLRVIDDGEDVTSQVEDGVYWMGCPEKDKKLSVRFVYGVDVEQNPKTTYLLYLNEASYANCGEFYRSSYFEHWYMDGDYYHGNVQIPESISLSDGIYPVTRIENLAFISNSWDGEANEDSLYVSIPESIREIGQSAFCYRSDLPRIELPASIQSIEDGAFYYCSNLADVKVLFPTPLEIAPNTFEGISPNATLYVPKGSKNAFKYAKYWRDFPNIVEISDDNYDSDYDHDGDGSISVSDLYLLVKMIMGQ